MPSATGSEPPVSKPDLTALASAVHCTYFIFFNRIQPPSHTVCHISSFILLSLFLLYLPSPFIIRWWFWWTPWRTRTTSCVPTAPGRRLTCLTWRSTTPPARLVNSKSVYQYHKCHYICVPAMCILTSSHFCAGGGVPSYNQRTDWGSHIRLQRHRVCLRTYRFVQVSVCVLHM